MRQPAADIIAVCDDAQLVEALLGTLEQHYHLALFRSLDEATRYMEVDGPPRIAVVIATITPSTTLPSGSQMSALPPTLKDSIPAVMSLAVSRKRRMATWTRIGLGRPDEFHVLDDMSLAGASSMLTRIMNTSRRRWVLHALLRATRALCSPVLAIAIVLMVWEAICHLLSVKEYLVPAPSRVIRVFSENGASLLSDTCVTAGEAIGGFALANIAALALAVCFVHAPWLERAIYPYLVALKSVPIIALSPLLILWIGYGPTSKVVMSGLVAFFPLVVNATTGLKAIDHEMAEMFRLYSATRLQVLIWLRFPASLPYIFAGLRVSSTLAVVGAVVAELTGARRGLGFTLMMASYNIDTPLLFAAILCSSALGIVLFLAVVCAERLFAPSRLSS